MRTFALLLAIALATAGCVSLARAIDLGPTVREYVIEAVDKDVELYPGKTVRMWTFNGQVPGPVIRATEGERVVVRFYNNGTAPHTLHFHGAHPFEMDGADHQGIAPGGSTTYDFIAGPAGAYVYHCHVDTPVHIPMGLYGQFIVDPKGGWSDARVDREFFVVMSDWNPKHETEAETYLFNGKAFPSTETLQVRTGERVRIFLSSLSDFPVAAHLHGYLPQQVWPNVQPIDVVPLAHAETRVLELTASAPGSWMFHDHYEQHLVNDGLYPGGGLSALEVGEEYWGHLHEHVEGAVPTPDADHDEHAHDETTGGPLVAAEDFRFEPATLTIEVGATVTWRNDGAAPHTVTGDGWDSGLLQPGERFTRTFDAPGTYEYRCVPHSAKGKDGAYAGMVGQVVVT